MMKDYLKQYLQEFEIKENEDKKEIALCKDGKSVVLGYSFTPKGKIYIWVKEFNGKKIPKTKTGTKGTLTGVNIRKKILHMLINSGWKELENLLETENNFLTSKKHELKRIPPQLEKSLEDIENGKIEKFHLD